MDPRKPSRRYKAEVASHIPGRLRIRLQPGSRRSQDMQRLQEKIGSKAGIHSVRSNPAAGSLTVQYDRDQYGKEGVLRLLEDADVVVADLTGSESVNEVDFKGAVEDLRRRTGIDLGKTLPLAFVGMGLWSFARNGWMIESVPGYFFLWWALDTFVKLHPQR